MKMKKSNATVYVGVDVAKATLQVHVQGRQLDVPNTPAGHQQLLSRLQKISQAQVICEATGGYEQGLVEALHQAQQPISVVNPAQVRASAQAQGQRAKNDRIDAALLTDYGQRFQPAPTPPVSEIQRRLVAQTLWLQQLITAQATAKVQAEHHHDLFVRTQHQALLEHYQQQIETVEAEIEKLLAQDSALAQRVERLDAIKGIGLRTALIVLAHFPELGQLNRQQVAALAGLAPWTRESGTMKGRCCIGGGRGEVRIALYMASLSAVKNNPILRAFYQRLRKKGKLGKVALTAVMRKLLVYMNHELKALAASSQSKTQSK